MNFLETITSITLLSPLIGALVLFFRKENLYSDKIATTLIGLSVVGNLCVFYYTWSNSPIVLQDEWFLLDQHSFKATLKIDQLSSMLLTMVSIVSLFVHVFSSAYMQGDPKYKKYFTLLGLFTFSMFGVLVSDNLIMLYLFWELVGFCSYMLIGFWREKNEAVKAAKKAFVLNRIGDAGFMIAIITLYSTFGTVSIEALSAEIDQLQILPLYIVGIGITMAAMGKSAQLPLSVWLPDAMQGPTPVSALIHAATMVAAGIYLLARCFFVLPAEIQLLIAIIGALTAFLGAFSALSQNDIKRILAYSTISQLGYMMIGIGVGDPEASIFHLTTHAFFKAGLFLGAGSIIHSMHQVSCDICKGFDPQDIRWMGNLRQYMPKTFIGFSICLAGLMGLPFTSGFLSKDAILSSLLIKASTGSWEWVILAFLGFTAASFTAFYSIRLLYQVFFGKLGIANHKVCKDCLVLPKEVNVRMTMPVMLLGVFTLWFFYTLSPLDTSHTWIQTGLSLETVDRSSVHTLGLLMSVGVVFLGAGGAYLIYFRDAFATIKKQLKSSSLHKLSYNFAYLDKGYKLGVKTTLFTANKLENIPHADEYFVGMTIHTSEFVRGFDDKVVDFLVKLFGVTNVVFGHMLAWFDRVIVDGIVTLLTKILALFGDVFRKPQGERTQSMIAWSIFLLLLTVLVLWFI
ncbi:NADH-quinone oxidoreductase subunit L [Flammeovirga sp. SJP92]|uniref:NADH-quinone oxidoreductase subunit 5 family protein n=1 Tax=Flammeovirga sp. SJP92 TaxID=1775430 RepID=UPI0009ED5C11|nr:NADH-quinone oxidoreductase subunit L [Flammeovirga sp. SJP92]